jgi:hypothetical protein
MRTCTSGWRTDPTSVVSDARARSPIDSLKHGNCSSVPQDSSRMLIFYTGATKAMFLGQRGRANVSFAKLRGRRVLAPVADPSPPITILD